MIHFATFSCFGQLLRSVASVSCFDPAASVSCFDPVASVSCFDPAALVSCFDPAASTLLLRPCCFDPVASTLLLRLGPIPQSVVPVRRIGSLSRIAVLACSPGQLSQFVISALRFVLSPQPVVQWPFGRPGHFLCRCLPEISGGQE